MDFKDVEPLSKEDRARLNLSKNHHYELFSLYSPREDTSYQAISLDVKCEKIASPGVAKSVSEDAVLRMATILSKGGLPERLEIKVNDPFREQLLCAASELVTKASNQATIRYNIWEQPLPVKLGVYGTTILCACAGAIAGYIVGAEPATNMAQSLNETSEYLAIVTGLLQAGVVTTSSASVGMALGAVGYGLSRSLSIPFVFSATPLVTKGPALERINRSLSRNYNPQVIAVTSDVFAK